MRSVETPVTRESIAHFGPGRLTVTPRGRRDEGTVWRMVFEPQTTRDRITVKVECERLQEGAILATEPRVLGMQKAVSYLKGRDIYDVWHLRDRLRVPVVRMVMERKFSCYAAPFTPRRRPAWFESNDKELVDAIEGDLRRFLSPEMMEVCRGDGYRRFLDAVKGVFRELREIGVVVPS